MVGSCVVGKMGMVGGGGGLVGLCRGLIILMQFPLGGGILRWRVNKLAPIVPKVNGPLVLRPCEWEVVPIVHVIPSVKAAAAAQVTGEAKDPYIIQ